MYEVWQTGVSARLSAHATIEAAARALVRERRRFRRSRDYNAGSLIGHEVRREDGEDLSDSERRTVDNAARAAR